MATYIPVRSPQSERVAEESKITEEYQAQIVAAEESARAAYDKELASKVTKIRSDYGAMIESEKAKYDLEVMISQAAETEEAKFIKSLGVQKKQIEAGYEKKVIRTRKTFKRKVQAGIQEAKRIAAREAKTYAAVAPRKLRAYKKTEYQMFEEAVGLETEVFEKEVKTWQERAVGEYETGLKEWKVEELAKQKKAMKEWEKAEKKTLETEISIYKKEAAAGLEAEIKEWKKEEAAKFEPHIEKWREAWQPKGLAEQMLEWKAPDLPKLDIELFKMPVKRGTLRIGFDLGKFAEGIAEGSVVAAAGVVASGESLAYSIGSLAGIKTPRPPPTLVAGLIQTVPESIGAGQIKPSPQLEEMAKQKYAFTYAAATLLGDVVISYAIGKGVEKGAAVIGKTRVGAYVGTKLQPALRPIAKFQYKLGKITAPVTRRMVKAAEWVISPIYKAKAVSLAAKAPAAAVPRGVLVDLTKPADLVDELTLTARMEARYGSIAAVIPEEQVGAVLQPLDEAIGLTAAEKWTSRAAREIPKIYPAMKPITQVKYGVAWGDPYFPYAKPTKVPVTLAETLAVKRWTVRAMKWQLGAGVLPTTADDLAGLPKKFSEYVKPMKLPTPPREGIVTQAGRQILIMEKPLVKLIPKVAPKVRISKWVVKAQKEALKVVPLAKLAVKVAPAVKPAEISLAAIIGVKAVTKTKLTLKQELQAVKQKQKEKEKLKVSLIPLQIPALAPALVPLQIPELKQPSLTQAVQVMKQEQIQRQKQIEKEEKRLRKKKKKKLLPWERRGLLLEYPVRPEKEVPSFIFEGLGKKSKGMNLDSAIFGKRRKKR